jgi:hypothetical protein
MIVQKKNMNSGRKLFMALNGSGVLEERMKKVIS